MNIFLWILQVVLALHTAIGAVWKFSNSPAQTMPSLGAIPNAAWLTMAVIELLFSLCLLLPAFNRQLGILAIVAAIGIAVEMLLFCGLHLRSDVSGYGPMIYWLVVAGVCAFIAYGRLVLKPF